MFSHNGDNGNFKGSKVVHLILREGTSKGCGSACWDLTHLVLQWSCSVVFAQPAATSHAVNSRMYYQDPEDMPKIVGLLLLFMVTIQVMVLLKIEVSSIEIQMELLTLQTIASASLSI